MVIEAVMKALSFESRRGAEMATLLRNAGWEPTVVPVFAEVPQEDPIEAVQSGAQLLSGAYEQIIFLTGVGVRHWWKIVSARYNEEALRTALSKTFTIPRGPKPAAALRELGITPSVLIREPATWREILSSLDQQPVRQTAVIEYGRRDQRLLDGLTDRAIPWESVAVYQYGFPEDFTGLAKVLEELAAGVYGIVLFTASVQYLYLAEAAKRLGVGDAWKGGLNRAFVASIGPTMSETLAADGIQVRFQPSASKMGIFVHELMQQNISRS